MWRKHAAFLTAATVAVFLAIGWGLRERAFAEEKAKLLESRTVNLADVGLKDYTFEDKLRGQIAIYLAGQTAGTRDFVVGQLRLKPGEEPHPIHKHVEEEVLIVASGKGEISCDGKTTKVGPGSVMYTAPNVPHGIKNTGDDVMTFYFIKFTARPK
jgi:mannose-6-phosphate isomerase-like protein (cupin superfamily)